MIFDMGELKVEWVIMLLLVLLLALESVSFASDSRPAPQNIVFYQDCMSERTPSFPVFTEWKDRGDQRIELPSRYFTKGLNIAVLQDASGKLTGVRFGDQIVISMSGLRSGVKFGALNSVMHTVEVEPGFDSSSGGIIRFGFYKSFQMTDIIHDLGSLSQPQNVADSEGSVSSSQKKLKGRNWGEKKYLVAKQDGQWMLLDVKSGQQIHATYTVMKTGNVFNLNGNYFSFLKMVTGLTNMVDEFVSNQSPDCPDGVPSQRHSKRARREARHDSRHDSRMIRSVIEDPESHHPLRCITD